MNAPFETATEAVIEVPSEIITLSSDMVRYDCTAEKIGEIREYCSRLTIAGVDDKAGYKAVDEARKSVKRLRCAVQNREKELGKPYLELGRLIKSRAKELIVPLEEIEEQQEKKLAAIDAERKRIEAEKAEAARIEALRIAEENRRKVQARLELLKPYTYARLSAPITAEMTDEEFDATLRWVKSQHEAIEAELAEKKRRQDMAEDRASKLRQEGFLGPHADLGYISDEEFELLLDRAKAEKAAREEEARRIAVEREELARARRELEAMRAALEAQQRPPVPDPVVAVAPEPGPEPEPEPDIEIEDAMPPEVSLAIDAAVAPEVDTVVTEDDGDDVLTVDPRKAREMMVNAADEIAIPHRFHAMLRPYNECRMELVVSHDGEEIACHLDGGEPEDNLFLRDYDWVAPLLNQAYRLGFKDGKEAGR